MDEQATTTGALDESNNHREHGAEEAACTTCQCTGWQPTAAGAAILRFAARHDPR